MRQDGGGFYGSGMADELSERYADLVTGSYDCVDRIVLNGYFSLGHHPGGFRTWCRPLDGSDDQLDDAHLMRMAGRLAHHRSGLGQGTSPAANPRAALAVDVEAFPYRYPGRVGCSVSPIVADGRHAAPRRQRPAVRPGGER